MTGRDEILEIPVKVKTATGWNLDNSYTNLPKLFFSSVMPTPVSSPKLIIVNHTLAQSLGLDFHKLESEDGLEVFAGNRVIEGDFSIAQAYAGHQFGHFTILGDGRAVLLGEQITPQGERFDIQLKGSGITPYSRQGDGRASLGPMLREYIISEAMHALGIPTTRSLAVVTTGESVYREYEQKGAILTRVAASHIRIGTFQYVSQVGTLEDLRALADYTLNRHFPKPTNGQNQYLFLLQQVMKRQALLIAKWQLVGFVHGVMNTDNMAISGETIDYGPCAFMDEYDPATVFSSIDRYGRYAYGNQPHMAEWNLARFAETLVPLLDENVDEAVKIAQHAISEFALLYENYWIVGMRKKLGIFNEEQHDEDLIEELLSMMQKYGADYTNTFKAITFDQLEDTVLFGTPELEVWYKNWQDRLGRQQEPRDSSRKLMCKCNPAVIPRNHKVEEALEAAEKQKDFNRLKDLLEALSSPYHSVYEQDEYSEPLKSNAPYRTFCGT